MRNRLGQARDNDVVCERLFKADGANSKEENSPQGLVAHNAALIVDGSLGPIVGPNGLLVSWSGQRSDSTHINNIEALPS